MKNYHKVTRGLVEQSRREGKSSMVKLDRLDLDLDHTYTLKEFEGINEQLKTRTLETGEEPVDLVELDASGKIIPMPQTPFCKEVVVAEIVRQIGNWNIYTKQGGGVTASQGGFNFETGRGRTIRAPAWRLRPTKFVVRCPRNSVGLFRGSPLPQASLLRWKMLPVEEGQNSITWITSLGAFTLIIIHPFNSDGL